MAKNLKLNIKNEQLAQAVNLSKLKSKLSSSKKNDEEKVSVEPEKTSPTPSSLEAKDTKEEAPRIKARSRSAFADPTVESATEGNISASLPQEASSLKNGLEPIKEEVVKVKSNAELRRQIFGEEMDVSISKSPPEPTPEYQYPTQPKVKPSSLAAPKEPVSEESSPKTEQAEVPAKEQPLESFSPRRTSPPRQEPRQGVQGFRSEQRQGSSQGARQYEPRDTRSSSGAYHSNRPDYRGRPSRPPESREAKPPYHRQETRGGPPHSRPDFKSEGPRQERPGQYSRQDAPRHAPSEKLGPTGKHVNDLLSFKPKSFDRSRSSEGGRPPLSGRGPNINMSPGPLPGPQEGKGERRRPPLGQKSAVASTQGTTEAEGSSQKRAVAKGAVKGKDFKDVKPVRKLDTQRSFDARDKHGLRADEESQQWRKKKAIKGRRVVEDTTIRPSALTIRVPITVKDLASEMKLKASQLIANLFMQGIAVTLNDPLEDETTIQLLGQEFGCEITIDRREEERIRVTGKSIREEIAEQDPVLLHTRAPIVAFMGHVDHGKTSLIDAIRKSNRAAGEAGAITQHIGAFRYTTPVGDIAILDTPGHEAFSAMRARGADVTDIVVLVVAGDEGMRQQTIEAINHAKAAGVTIIVAINKSDKPNFNPELVYRQLADQNLLPESWGGQIITVNCSAVTGEGIQSLLEMLAIQAEVLELKAQPSMRARGSVLESELHKGLGNVTTILVQNGTLRRGDPLVFSQYWGRVKTMRNEYGQEVEEAGPSTPVEITGLSGLPDAGEEFIVVKTEKEARSIAEARSLELNQRRLLQGRKITLDNLFQKSSEASKKILNVIIRADVQGSLEALRNVLEKIHSDKVMLNIVMGGVGEISESDIQMAETSKAVILGFHTQVEAHAEPLAKQYGVAVYLEDIIYHAVDKVKELMAGTLDKIAEETEKGVAEVKATFKSSQYGIIAGCQVTEGSIHRSNLIRLRRGKEVIWKGNLHSLRRVKEDVREVQKGYECGIVLNGFNEVQAGDIIEAYEITYRTQEL